MFQTTSRNSIEAQRTIVEETQQRVEAERRTACQVKAARIWARLDDNDGSNSPATIQALWNLATGGTQIHEAFLEQIAGSANLDDRLGTGIVNLGRALGVRPHAREIQQLWDLIVRTVSPAATLQYLRSLCQAAETLRPKLTPEQAESGLGSILAEIQNTLSLKRLRVLVRLIQILGPKLDKEQARSALGRVLTAFSQINDHDQRWAF